MVVERSNEQNNMTFVKLELFRLSKEIFAVFGLKPDQFIFRPPFNRRGLFMVSSQCLSIISFSLSLFLEANTFNQYAVSLFMTFAVISAFAVYAVCLWKRKAYSTLMACLEKAINRRLIYPSSKSIYNKYNGYVDTFCKWLYIGLVKVVPIGSMSPFLIFSYFSYYFLDLGKDAFIQPFPMWFPYDWKYPGGYLVTFFVEVFLLNCAAIVAVLATNFGVGIAFIVIAMAEDVNVNLCSISDRANNHSNRPQLVIDFKDFIGFYSDTKQYCEEYAETFKPVLGGVLSVNVLLICPALLMIQIELSQGMSISTNLAVILLQVTGAFFFLIVVCEFGARITSAHDEIYSVILQLSWYNFPVELQSILPFVISIAQKGVVVYGYGSVACSRETFKRIIKCGFSYFMTLRQFY